MRSLGLLMPCPFCGGEAALGSVRYTEKTAKENGWHQTEFHSVNCIRCGVSNQGLVGHRDQETAAMRWNTRVKA